MEVKFCQGLIPHLNKLWSILYFVHILNFNFSLNPTCMSIKSINLQATHNSSKALAQSAAPSCLNMGQLGSSVSAHDH